MARTGGRLAEPGAPALASAIVGATFSSDSRSWSAQHPPYRDDARARLAVFPSGYEEARYE